MRLLIVDDEFIIRKGLTSLKWERVGIDDVVVAEDGLQARDILKQQNVDIVLSDIRMPGLDGLELAQYVKDYTAGTKVILLTGFSDFQYAQTAIRANVFEYLLKPLDPKELFGSVRAAIQAIERERYMERLVDKYEEAKGAHSAAEQVLYDFQDAQPAVQEILKFICEGYNTDLSLTTLSERFHFTTIHLSRLIKKETGYSFIEILLAIRLMNAAKLLRRGGMKIHRICEQVGFNDQRYFSQIFRRVFDCTPLEYRKREGEAKAYTLLELLELIGARKRERGEAAQEDAEG